MILPNRYTTVNLSGPENRKPNPSVLITGASSGLGRELAIQFARAGYSCILSGRNPAELLRTSRLATENGTPCTVPLTTISGDLREVKTINRLTEMMRVYNTRTLISCASVYSNLPLESCDNADDILLTNLVATVNVVRAAYEIFKTSMEGTIVNINSVAGKAASENESVYAASKHGLTGFFRALRLEARHQNIRILDVFTGGMKTPMTKDRPDWDYLIDPVEAAKIIFPAVINSPQSLQIDEITLSRFRFPM